MLLELIFEQNSVQTSYPYTGRLRVLHLITFFCFILSLLCFLLFLFLFISNSLYLYFKLCYLKKIKKITSIFYIRNGYSNFYFPLDSNDIHLLYSFVYFFLISTTGYLFHLFLLIALRILGTIHFLRPFHRHYLFLL